MISNNFITHALFKVGVPVLVLAIFLLNTSPRELPIALLMVPFLLLFIAVFFTAHVVVSRVRVAGPSAYIFSVIIALIPVLALILKSISQLTPRDMLLMVLFMLLLLAYVTKLKTS